jgi:hypothetical protein
MIKCKICNGEYKRISATHLKKHNITVSDYIKQFPDAPLEDVETTMSRRVTLENLQSKYGEIDGLVRWEEYKQKQAYSNSFEYKRDKYGWTESQFNEYNKKRGSVGELNGNYGSSYYQVWVEKYGRDAADEMNFELSKRKARCGEDNGNYGRTFSDKTIKRMSLSAIERVKRNGMPHSYNPNAIPIIEQYGKENGYNFQHAENGGEYQIPNHTFFVDGYDAEKNVVIEYDEPHHFKNGELHPKDIWRMNLIISELNCIFVRIDYNGNITIYENN